MAHLTDLPQVAPLQPEDLHREGPHPEGRLWVAFLLLRGLLQVGVEASVGGVADLVAAGEAAARMGVASVAAGEVGEEVAMTAPEEVG